MQQLLSEFKQWADERGCTLRPAFGRSNVDSSANDTTKNGEYTILPLLCLAIYDGGTIHLIYPHMTPDDVHTIHDGITALESMRQDRDQMEVDSNKTSTATTL